MLSAMKFLNNQPVLAFTSDASIDFSPDDFSVPLDVAQQAYIKKETGLDIPQVFWRKQIHGDDVIVAVNSPAACQACPDADAYITNERNLPIAIRTADCVPVFMYDPLHKVIGLAHAGWKGTVKGIAVKTLNILQDKFNSQGSDVQVAIGPCIRPCCYQVGAEFKEHFPQDITERNGHLYVDVAANNRRQLIEAGVSPANISDCGICTCCDTNYFSFRRDAAKAGRMISLMMLLWKHQPLSS